MITIPVDEAYAFDYLSILDVKRQKSENNYESWNKCYNYLRNQFDSEKWYSMIHSKEYQDMLSANLKSEEHTSELQSH